jgi:hypothetical protein
LGHCESRGEARGASEWFRQSVLQLLDHDEGTDRVILHGSRVGTPLDQRDRDGDDVRS